MDRRGLAASAAAVVLALSLAAQAQTPPGPAAGPRGAASSGSPAWFGLVMPGPATEQVLDFSKVDVPMAPAPPVGPAIELDGAKAHKYVEDVVAFSEESRASGVRTWGRIAASPAAEHTADYVAAQFRQAGLADVVKVVAPYAGPAPVATEWKVALIGAPEFGAGSGDVELQSAFPMDARPEGVPGTPLPPGVSPITRQSVTAPLVYIGDGTAAQVATTDIRGKVVVMRAEPLPSVFFASTFRSVQQMVNAGAAGVLVVYDTPGNMQIHYGTCIGAPCFALGGEDGDFLNTVIARAARAGVLGKLQVSLSQTVEAEPDEHGWIVIAKVKGRQSDENLIVSAHSDSWLVGANDNASGVAGLIALARHYAKGPPPRHDMYFVLSPGHHSPTGSLKAFIALHPEAPTHNILTINLEHIAQQATVRSSYNAAGLMGTNTTKYGTPVYGWQPANGDSLGRQFAGDPITPAVKALIRGAAARTGFVGPSSIQQGAPGELAQIVAAGATGIQDVETSMWYHTSGDTSATVAPESLQRVLLFYKDILDHADQMTRAEVRAGAP